MILTTSQQTKNRPEVNTRYRVVVFLSTFYAVSHAQQGEAVVSLDGWVRRQPTP